VKTKGRDELRRTSGDRDKSSRITEIDPHLRLDLSPTAPAPARAQCKGEEQDDRDGDSQDVSPTAPWECGKGGYVPAGNDRNEASEAHGRTMSSANDGEGDICSRDSREGEGDKGDQEADDASLTPTAIQGPDTPRSFTGTGQEDSVSPTLKNSDLLRNMFAEDDAKKAAEDGDKKSVDNDSTGNPREEKMIKRSGTLRKLKTSFTMASKSPPMWGKSPQLQKLRSPSQQIQFEELEEKTRRKKLKRRRKDGENQNDLDNPCKERGHQRDGSKIKQRRDLQQFLDLEAAESDGEGGDIQGSDADTESDGNVSDLLASDSESEYDEEDVRVTVARLQQSELDKDLEEAREIADQFKERRRKEMTTWEMKQKENKNKSTSASSVQKKGKRISGIHLPFVTLNEEESDSEQDEEARAARVKESDEKRRKRERQIELAQAEEKRREKEEKRKMMEELEEQAHFSITQRLERGMTSEVQKGLQSVIMLDQVDPTQQGQQDKVEIDGFEFDDFADAADHRADSTMNNFVASFLETEENKKHS